MDRFALTFALPAVSAPDVTTRELTITIDGQDEPIVQKLNVVAVESDKVEVDENAMLSVTLVDIDNAGNRSAPSPAFIYVVLDDVVPPAPGQVGVASKVELPPVPPAPPAQPPV